MSATFYAKGDRLPYSNISTAIAEGDVVIITSGTSGYIGIAVSDIAATTGTGELEVGGVWTLPKTSGEAFTFGQVVYWDGTALTGTSSSTFTRAGIVAEAAGSAATTAKAKLFEP